MPRITDPRAPARTDGFFLSVLLLLAIPVPSSSSGYWTSVPLPSRVEYISALTAGNQYLFAAMVDSSGGNLGLFRTPLQDPATWQHLGLEGRLIRGIVPSGEVDAELLVGASGDPLVQYSSDGGSHWSSSLHGRNLQSFSTMAWNGRYPGRVYVSAKTAGTYDSIGVFVSSDFGRDWEYWHLCSGCVTTGLLHIAAPQNGSLTAWGTTYGGYFTTGLFKTDDGGAIWGYVGDPDWCYPLDLQVSPRDEQECYSLGTCAVVVIQGDQVIGQFAPPFVAQLAIEAPPWHPETIYAVGRRADGRAGVSFATRPWTTWSALDEGLPTQTLPENPESDWDKYQFVAVHGQPTLFLSLRGMGLWRCDLSDVAAVQLDHGASFGSVRLSNPCPNPMRGVTIMSVETPDPAIPWSIDVVDIRGRVVRHLAAGRGSRINVTWDAALASGHPAPMGVYHFRLTTTTGEVVKSIVVLH